jgi:hypothetical protein
VKLERTRELAPRSGRGPAQSASSRPGAAGGAALRSMLAGDEKCRQVGPWPRPGAGAGAVWLAEQRCRAPADGGRNWPHRAAQPALVPGNRVAPQGPPRAAPQGRGRRGGGRGRCGAARPGAAIGMPASRGGARAAAACKSTGGKAHAGGGGLWRAEGPRPQRRVSGRLCVWAADGAGVVADARRGQCSVRARWPGAGSRAGCPGGRGVLRQRVSRERAPCRGKEGWVITSVRRG